MKGMIYAGESPPMMETPSTTFGKQKLVIVTRYQAIFSIVFFVTCVVATALLVYYFSPCHNCSRIKESTVIVYDKLTKNGDSTTTTAGVVVDDNCHHTTEGAAVTSTLALPVASISTEEPKTDDQKTIDVRLPRSIHPHSYKIKLVPFIQEGNFTFHGDVKILINVSVSSRNITLHADELIIDDVFVYEYLKPDQFISIESFANDTRRQFLIIHLQNPVEAGTQYYVNIKFRGILNDLLQGFYRSSYKVGNETRWIAATQFQATDARKAFPCFDEPALKAKFQLNLARFKNMTSISNMRRIHDPIPVTDLPDYEWDTYEESLPMSTYLVAFVISDFGNITNGPFSIWARRSALSQANYSLQVGPKILTFYEDFFGIKYPLPKVDMVALPDFSAGAMENWGLITYRESALLYEEKVSSKNSLDNIVHVIAHELAHQWFGNLVTPTWWTDLWLNEGFATYVEFLGANSVNPDWKILDQFLILELHVALTLDAFQSSHPISIVVNDPDEIDDIFDQISYSKGAAILRMMQHFLSMETFRKGLHRYLSERVYKSAEQDDLWEALTRQSHEDQIIEPDVTIKQIMDTWTLQTGYPVVKAERNYRNGSVVFSQERFLNSKNSNKTSESWWVPLTLKTSSNDSVSSFWIRNEPRLHLNNLNLRNTEWLLVNINQTGYYRVNYDETNWNLLMRQLQKKDGHLIFDPKNRAQLLDDAMKLASAGHIDYRIALNLTKYLVQEREYVPWMAALNGLDYLYERFVRTQHFDKYKNYLLHLIDGFYKEIGFRENEYDSQLRIYSRHEIYQRACRLGVRDCIINAVQQFQTWRNSPNPDKYNLISENLREVVYCTAMSVGGQEEWDFAWQRYLNANVGNEKEILLMALGCSKEIWILSRYLEWSITENSGIRKQDSARVFATVANNLVGQELAYRFLKTNLGRLKTYLGTSSMALSSIIRSCTARMDTQEEVDDFKNFLKKNSNDIGVGLRTTQQVLEQSMFRVKWMETNFKNIVQWLSSVNS